MELRTASILMVATSALVLGSYACVGSDPTAQDGIDSGEPATDASTNDATQSGGDSSTPADATTDTDSGVDAGPSAVTRAFVSSMKYYGGSIGGLAGADTACQGLATAAGRGSGWKAWLSTSTTNAKDRLVLGSGSIMLVDGVTVVVEHGTDLIGDGGLEHGISEDEHGTAAAAQIVWTGTTEHGLIYTGSANNTCHDWAIEDGGGSIGSSNQTGVTWTNDAIEPCSNSYAIYCFGP